MAISVIMPALEMAQETGKLISWLKKEGESVAKGEPLLEIETSPKARRLAAERGVDLARVSGSGPGGEILALDIIGTVELQPNSAPAHSSSISRLMAERTTQSWTTVPHFFVVRDVDAGAL